MGKNEKKGGLRTVLLLSAIATYSTEKESCLLVCIVRDILQ